ncbi:MAG: response regulator [Desulfobacterales bacterium]|nr:MAG: response regulator [Desulfobacterales bacterium]
MQKRIITAILIPIVLIGSLLSFFLISFLTPPIISILKKRLDANLINVSDLGIAVCEERLDDLIEYRLENDQSINDAYRKLAGEEVKAISYRFPEIEIAIIDEDGREVSTPAETPREPLDASLFERSTATPVALTLWGERVIVHYRYFPFWRWNIVSLISEKDYFAPIAMAKRLIAFGTFGILVVVMVIFVILFVWRIDRPLNQIIDATEKVAQGEMGLINVRRKDEIAKVALAFNSMVQSLRDEKTKTDAILSKLNEYRQAVESSEDKIVAISPEYEFLFVNEAFLNYHRKERAQVAGERVDRVLDQGVFESTIKPNLDECLGGKTVSFEMAYSYPEIGERDLLVSYYPLKAEEGKITGAVGVIKDVSDQKKAERERIGLENQLRQAQKMEAVGTLAGGIAHDFNNLLAPIMGYSEMLLEDLASDDRGRQELNEIYKAAIRGRELTHQLLAFSRKQVLELQAIDLNSVISDLKNMLRRLIREDIQIEYRLRQSPCTIRADRNQIEQVIINLAVNAQDAMPNGGDLIIETSAAILDEGDPLPKGQMEIVAGPYVLLALTDTGSGIDEDTKEHIFEPFFTTKPKDKGIGMGLATVYGIVKQHSGHIRTHSEPNQGTTFKVYLPQASGRERKTTPKTAGIEMRKGAGETILVAEDDPPVLNLIRQILTKQDYRIIEASSAAHCLEIAGNCQEPIHLLLTDVVMPEMNGKELYEKIKEYYPEIKVLYISGYTDNLIADRGILRKGTHLIQKPFSMKALLTKIQEILDS